MKRKSKVIKLNPPINDGGKSFDKAQQKKNQKEAIYGLCIILIGLTSLFALIDWLFF